MNRWNGFALVGALVVSVTCCVDIEAKDGASGSPAVGQPAPDFSLPVVGGDGTIRLSEVTADGPAVVVVLRGYPGYQCSLCSRQVGAMVNRAKALAGAASRVILVYPGPASMLDKHAEQFLGSRTLPEPLVMVRDDDMAMVNAWGLRWKAPRETAYPATFVIEKGGKVGWRMISDSHAGRSNVDAILGALKKK